MKRPPASEALKRAKALRREATPAETLLWKHLRGSQMDGHKFRRQMWLGPFIADFACVEARLVVEADGGQHSEAEEYDARRSAWMAREGYRVLRFWNGDVLTNIDGVLYAIHCALGQAEPSPSHRLKEAAGPSLSPNGRVDVGSTLIPFPTSADGGVFDASDIVIGIKAEDAPDMSVA